MKKLFFILLFTLSAICFSSEEANNYTGLPIGEKAKILDKTKDYNLRLYCFVELSSCSICTNWAIHFGEKYQDSNMEIVMILNNTTQEDADKLKKDLDWKLTVIGDEYGVFHSFYKIKFPVTMLVLDYEGILLDAGKLASPKMSGEHIDELLEIEKKRVKPSDSQNYMKLKEISRIPVMKDSSGLVSGFWRFVLYDKTDNKYYIRNNMNCPIIIVNSSGKIIKYKKDSEFYNCDNGPFPMSWAFTDSIIGIPSFSFVNNRVELSMSYLNVKNDSIYKFIVYQFHKRNEMRNHSIGMYVPFNTDKNEFTIFDDFKSNTSIYLNKKDTIFYVFDFEGKVKNSFGEPDEIYGKYKLTNFISHTITNNNKGEVITLQTHTKKLQFWDENKELIKTKELDLLNDFKILNHDIDDTLTSSNLVKLRNEMSQFPELFNDRTNGNLLLFWLNQTYTDENASSFYSESVINKPILCLLDKDGNRLTDKNILMPPTFKPYMVDKNLVYGTELNKNKLELVVYSLEEK